MSLRLKLLLLGLATLVLPWTGIRYAREMEAALRDSEQHALQAVAETIAASLQGRMDLLYREPPEAQAQGGPPPEGQAQGGNPGESAPTNRSPYDLPAVVLTAPPYIDGYPDDWPHDTGAWRYYGTSPHRFRVLTGTYDRMLYGLLEVRDPHLVFDAPGANPLDSSALGDRVWIGYEDPQRAQEQVFLALTGPGPIIARRVEAGEYGEETATEDPRIVGALQPNAGGYDVEIAMPLSMVGSQFGILLDDRDKRGASPLSYGTLRSDDLHTLGRLIVASPSLTPFLAQFMQPGLRLSVTTPDGAVLAQADELAVPGVLAPEPGILTQVYRRFVDRQREPAFIASAAPITDAGHHTVIGELTVTQAGNRWEGLRDRALTRMLDFTLVTSVALVIVTFAFAAWLALRLSRLRRASESALTREGLVTEFPETAAPDELGDVARSFSRLLRRLNEYTGYLRSLAGKLAHEIRTPLTIVRSSLENLESEQVSAAARQYLERARQGSERLSAILVAMGAATRVEEAIGNAERSRFDLTPVIASAVSAYGVAFPERRFAAELASEPVEIDGAPDLIVQLLDKLIDNAVDFSPPGATITVRLRREAAAAVLEVDNPGPPLAPEARGRLFESLWQSRSGSDSRPHFGLGLYIVRLIAEYHRGGVAAADLPGGEGARFGVRLPLADTPLLPNYNDKVKLESV
ncbi:MAG TPA: ATP-binding protein [Steroidobacteraceae bacterium]|nr:ATP-binding protein [Steroidobacteraceae bacterium]